jgi:hypothetical protein
MRPGHCTRERLERFGVLAAGAELDAARDIHRERPHHLDRLCHVVGTQAAGEDHRDVSAMSGRELPGERLAAAAAHTGAVAVEQVKVGVERRQRLDVRAAADAAGLDHLAARAPADFGAEGGTLVAVQLDHRQTDRLRRPRHEAQRRVDEHPDDLETPLEARRDLHRGAELAPPGRLRREDQADRPRASLRGARRVPEIGEAAELDPGALFAHSHIVGAIVRLGARGASTPRPPATLRHRNARLPRSPRRS